MITKHEARVTKDLANKKITVVKEFDADVEKVWEAWTESSILDQWWAPKPWRAETKKMDFRKGGYWHYSMTGPDNNRVWGRLDYKTIEAPNQIIAVDSFSDENGNKAEGDFPSVNWTINFSKARNGTKVEVLVVGNKTGDVEKLLEMGFEQGFTMALDNLEELITK